MDKNLHDLIEDLKYKKQTVLFLGSGVNFCPGKKLLWNDILSEFLKSSLPLLNMSQEDIKELQRRLNPNDKGSRDSSEFSMESTVTVVKKLLGDDYVSLLQNIIYLQASPKILKEACEEYVKARHGAKETPFYSLFAVSELILRNDNIKAVVSYNYDNLLTQAIQQLQKKPDYFNSCDSGRLDASKFRPIDVYSGWYDTPFDNTAFLIYHPHGYIQPPFELKPDKRNKIVMTMEEFYENARDVYSWQTATQIHFLTHYMCIYIGASLSDMNMQRLLTYADIEYNNEAVYYIARKGNAVRHLKEIFHTENHMKVVSTESYPILYAELLNKKKYE